MSFHDQIDPFSTVVIEKLPAFQVDSGEAWEGFKFNNNLEGGLFRLNDVDSKHLPDITPSVFHLDLQQIPLPDLSSPSSSSSSESGQETQQTESGQGIDEEILDFWSLPDITQRPPKNRLIGWDSFLDIGHVESPTPYLSEADPQVFSAILRSSDQGLPLKSITTDALLHAAFELGMGRSSALFKWNEEEGKFARQWGNIAARGYSARLVGDLFEEFLKIGTYTRILTKCFDCLDNHTQQLAPSRIAFLAASRSVLYSIQEHLESFRPEIVSLLQLKCTMSRADALVTTLKGFVDSIQNCQTDPVIVSALMQQAANASLRHPGMDGVLQHIMSRTLRPLITRLLSTVGLSRAPTNAQEGQSLDDDPEAETYWTPILPPDLCETVAETRQSLRILQSNALDWSLSTFVYGPSSFASNLELGCTFDEICELQAGAVAYEAAMKKSRTLGSSPDPTSVPCHPIAATLETKAQEEDISRPHSGDPFHLATKLFDEHVPILNLDKADTLHDGVNEYLDRSKTEVSPFQLDYMDAVTLSITPLVSAQHRLLSYSVLRLLFQDHKLLAHLRLQRGFQLLGDGFFSSRLSMALFDSDQNSSEGHRRTGTSTGLRLQARDTWPPASSELRLVLMGSLSDSLASSTERFLMENLSFAIRDMPVDELEKCRDVNSIHALDFLRLEYKPPSEVLETVLTPEILDKYDRIFQHLLRVSRVHSVTQSLLRQNFDGQLTKPGTLLHQKVIVQMHHFTSTWADYCHNIAIAGCWKKFEDILHDVDKHITNNDYDRTLQLVKSQDYLRALHERTLDKILHALLLKRKQSGAREVLEDVFTLILRFAAARKSSPDRQTSEKATSSNETITNNEVHETTTKNIAKEFGGKVTRFIHAVQAQRVSKHASRPQRNGANATTASNESAEDEDGDDDKSMLFDCLLLRLDMFGYWSHDDRQNSAMHMMERG
ncbi:hypothetical protein A1O1_00129 [Capronia coronata CBS 617.96]|uniref:Spindle pole body component n=1 Tax=Capronia coronata CBS 617.96 TaxID=1182541 RepID=W9Z0C1_9EURO|nr:uncharacterized protein A1O1_00129 [Capronia coronata CBS 617.96]EXJ95011.1 hypothetical protein A1O1_00129 [Capronia coronata CBS 617.96]